MRTSNPGSVIRADMLVLAAGGCAEHEFGIKPMLEDLGVQGRPCDISQVLAGTGSADRWPTCVEDFRVTRGEGITFVEMCFSVPAAVARKVAARPARRYDGGLPQKACQAYLDAMTANGQTRVPSVKMRVAVLGLLPQWNVEQLEAALGTSLAEVTGPLELPYTTVRRVLDAASQNNLYLADVEDLLAAQLAAQGYLPGLTEEQTENAVRALNPRAAWDRESFCIAGMGEAVDHLRAFAQAFRAGTAYCGLQSEKNPFARAGLAFVSSAANTEELQRTVREQWAQHRELLARVQATGVLEALKQSGKRFFALSPRLTEEGELTFWLNPMEQSRYNYGWMSTQDLLDWANNTGRIVKAAA